MNREVRNNILKQRFDLRSVRAYRQRIVERVLRPFVARLKTWANKHGGWKWQVGCVG